MTSSNTSFEIFVENAQRADGELTRLREHAKCSYRMSRGVYYIKYRTDDAVCMIKVSDRTIKIHRTAHSSSEIVCESGKISDVVYSTPYGDMPFKAETTTLEYDLSDRGGEIRIKYTLDLNGDKLYNDVKIRIAAVGV